MKRGMIRSGFVWSVCRNTLRNRKKRGNLNILKYFKIRIRNKLLFRGGNNLVGREFLLRKMFSCNQVIICLKVIEKLGIRLIIVKN